MNKRWTYTKPPFLSIYHYPPWSWVWMKTYHESQNAWKWISSLRCRLFHRKDHGCIEDKDIPLPGPDVWVCSWCGRAWKIPENYVFDPLPPAEPEIWGEFNSGGKFNLSPKAIVYMLKRRNAKQKESKNESRSSGGGNPECPVRRDDDSVGVSDGSRGP